MSDPDRRARSNRRLLIVLALAVAPPVVLVLGPFRDRFFPPRAGELQALARVAAPRLDEAAVRELAGARLGDAAVAELARDAGSGRWEALAARLAALPRDLVTPGLMYLHGVAALQSKRPAAALAGLDAARRADDPGLSHEAGFALAQAFLMLERREPALALLRELAASPGARRAEAAAQLAALERRP